jgi:hypothetical protein
MQTRQSRQGRSGRIPRSTQRATVLAIIIALGFAAPVWATCGEIEPLSALPADLICPGWSRDGDPLTAHTPEQLTEIIDGGAFLYIGYGFVAAAFQNYAAQIAGVPTAATVAVFNQDTPENALALYQDPGSGEGTPVLDWPGTGAARVQISFGSVTFQFHQDCFFTSIVLLPGDEAAVPQARCLAEAVLDLVQGATPAQSASWGAIKNTFE